MKTGRRLHSSYKLTRYDKDGNFHVHDNIKTIRKVMDWFNKGGVLAVWKTTITRNAHISDTLYSEYGANVCVVIYKIGK